MELVVKGKFKKPCKGSTLTTLERKAIVAAREAELQARIDAVVEKALKAQAGKFAGIDVINDHRRGLGKRGVKIS